MAPGAPVGSFTVVDPFGVRILWIVFTKYLCLLLFQERAFKVAFRVPFHCSVPEPQSVRFNTDVSPCDTNLCFVGRTRIFFYSLYHVSVLFKSHLGNIHASKWALLPSWWAKRGALLLLVSLSRLSIQIRYRIKAMDEDMVKGFQIFELTWIMKRQCIWLYTSQSLVQKLKVCHLDSICRIKMLKCTVTYLEINLRLRRSFLFRMISDIIGECPKVRIVEASTRLVIAVHISSAVEVNVTALNSMLRVQSVFYGCMLA